MSASLLNIFFQWRTAVVIEAGDGYCFPRKFTGYFRETYAIPAVYQWRVLRAPGEPKEPVYIGEAEDVVYRIQRVLTPPRKAKESNTNRRLNEIFTKYIAAGRTVALDIADIEPFEINGIRFGSGAMADRFKRRMMENLMLVIAQEAKNCELLNVVVDPLSKVESLIKKLKPHEKREILRRYGRNISE